MSKNALRVIAVAYKELGENEINNLDADISYIESGLKSMSLDTFVLIANALGVSPERLLMEQITDTERCASEEITLLLSDCTIHLKKCACLNTCCLMVE